MHFYYLSIQLFADNSPDITHQSTGQQNPGDIISNAKVCLHTLIRLYYSCHGDDTFDMWIFTAATFLAFASIDDAAAIERIGHDRGSEWYKMLHSSIIICAKVLFDQSRNFFMAEAIFHLLYSQLPPEDAHKLRGLMIQPSEICAAEDFEKRQQLVVQHVRSEWSIPIAGITDASKHNKLENFIFAFSTTPNA